MRWMLAVALLTGACVFAHHSFNGTYLVDQRVALEGKVVSFAYRNPHTLLEIDAADAAGRTQRWEIEWGQARQLAARGITRDTLKAGDQVSLTISPSREAGKRQGLLRLIRRASDGFEWGTKPGEEAMEFFVQAK